MSEKKTAKEEKENNVVISEKDEASQKEAEMLSSLPDDMPQEIKRQVVSMMVGRSTSMSGAGARHPLFDKFTDDHIHKYLDYIQRDDDNEYDLKRSNRWFHLSYSMIALIFFGFLIVYLLPKDKALLNDILKFLFTFAGGVGSGYGIKSYIEKK